MTVNTGSRLATIDALRGVAALLVAIFHIRGALGENLSNWLPTWIFETLSIGFVGVAIFFVISGFVIALTLSSREVNLSFVGRFALRRSLRLDPPYWFAIAAEILLIYVAMRVFPGQTTAVPPSVEKIIAHIFYLQDILGYGNIAAVFWTLCIELQFYLFYAFCLAVVQTPTQPLIDSNGHLSSRAVVVFGLTAITGILCVNKWVTPPVPGLFISYWPYFLAGAMIAWVYASGLKEQYFYGYFSILLLCVLVQPTPYLVAALITSAFLLYVAKRRIFSTALAFKPLLYLGTISYSLYLFHSIVGWRAVILVKKLHPDAFSPTLTIVVFLGALAASILSADLAFRLIERPSMNFAKKIRY